MLECSEVWRIVARFPSLSQIWDRRHIFKDCQVGFKQPWLNRLAEDPDEEILSELENLDRYLGTLNVYAGFQKLVPRMRARNNGSFASAVSEVKTAAWLRGFGVLISMYPELASGEESDFLINVANQQIHGEVYEPRDLPSTRVSRGIVPIFLTHQKMEAPKRANILGRKGSRQLPSHVVGMWVSHIYHHPLVRSWVDFFEEDMKHRQNVLGVAFWVRSGSQMPAQCVPCQGLVGDDHRIYWLDNNGCNNILLQRRLLCCFIE
ncbi:MAG: hypothetical protein ACFFCW_43265 [Candidatus Hodarchaeota archaeon]